MPPDRSQGRKRDGDTRHLQDPRDIRALAHPARLAIIDALASGDELTATECATLTGLSPSATAYHLKFLERYGLAEPAPARGDGSRGSRVHGPHAGAGRAVPAERVRGARGVAGRRGPLQLRPLADRRGD